MKKYFLHIILLLTFSFTATAQQGKIMEANAVQYVSQDSLIIELRLRRLTPTPFALGAANFSLYFNENALDIQNATFETSSPWDASQNASDYLSMDIKKLSDFFVVNTLTITASTGTGSIVDTAFTRLTRIAIPILDPSQTSNLAWRTAPIAILNWEEKVITPQVLFTLDTSNMNLCFSPETPVISFVGNTSKTLEICQGNSLIINIDSTSAVQYEVYKDGQLWAQISQDSFLVNEAGEYYVLAKNYACASDTSRKLYVNVIAPLTQPQIIKQGDTLFCANCEGQDVQSYQWFLNGQPVGTGSFITDLQNGFYTLQISNSCGSQISEIFDNTVTKTNIIVEGGEIMLFPNPVLKDFTVKTSLRKSAFVSYELYDEYGRFVKQIYNGKMQAGTNFLSVDASPLASGAYFLKIKINNLETQPLKIIVAR